MTAAPGPRIRLVLVPVYSSFFMVATARRRGTVTRGYFPHHPSHSLYLHRCIPASRTTILCPQGKTKQRMVLLQLCSPLPCEMRNDAGDPDQQYEDPKTPPTSRTLICRLSPQTQEKETRPPHRTDRHEHDLGQPAFTSTRNLRFRCTSLDA